MLNKVLFLVGPTGVGKTEVAMELVKKIPLEVISCDSMQVYREINIASSKPSPKMLKELPHHLINVVSVKDEYNAADFSKEALRQIGKIQKRGNVPLVSGGSGLYMSAILDGIFKGVKKNQKLREELEGEAKNFGNLYLYEKLKRVDPACAEKIHPHDLKRVIRALEVFTLTKSPISVVQKNRAGIWGKFDIRIFGLMRERKSLYARIDQRVLKMFKNGLLKEIKSVLKKPLSLTASYCLGVKEIKDFLSGRCSLEEAKQLIQRNSRRYAKRQMTWFRKDKRINWIEIKNNETPKQVAEKILSQMKLRAANYGVFGEGE